VTSPKDYEILGILEVLRRLNVLTKKNARRSKLAKLADDWKKDGLNIEGIAFHDYSKIKHIDGKPETFTVRFEKEDEAYSPTKHFDLKLRQNFKQVIEEEKEPNPNKAEDYLVEATVQTLNDYGFFKKERSIEEVTLTVKILHTFLKDDLMEKIVKALGV